MPSAGLCVRFLLYLTLIIYCPENVIIIFIKKSFSSNRIQILVFDNRMLPSLENLFTNINCLVIKKIDMTFYCIWHELFFIYYHCFWGGGSRYIKYGGYHIMNSRYERDWAISNQSDYRFYLHPIKIFDLIARLYDIIRWYY
jgi:hypothetical protein